jgi:general secretion pathway protein D
VRRALASLLALSIAIGAPAQPALARQTVLNVQDADIRAFIQDVARATGRTFIVDPRVRGTVTVASDQPLNRSELFEVLLSTLRANGLVAIPTASGAFRIAPEEGAAQAGGVGGGGAGEASFATEIFRLRNVDAASAADALKPLVGRQGVVLPVRRGNLVVVSDYADNLRRIRGLVAQVDQDRTSTEIVTLQNSSAREIAAVVNEMLKAPGDDPNARNGLVSLVVVESSNSVILRGEPGAVQRLLPLIGDLDRRAQLSDDVRVVRLQHASAEQMLPVLQQIVGQPVTEAPAPTQASTGASLEGGAARAAGAAAASTAAAPLPAGVTSAMAPGQRANIARFPGANALVIAADPETQRMLAEVIRQLDVRREQVLVEAIVVEVSDELAKELGVQMLLAPRHGDGPAVITNYTNTGPNLRAIAGAVAGRDVLPPSVVNELTGAAVDSLVGGGALIGGIGALNRDTLFGAVLNAVRRDTASNVLSTPSIMTLDNQPATILVGQEVPITTGEVLADNNSNPFRTVQRQNVGVQLEVRPQINAGGAITLFLRQEVSGIADTVTNAVGDIVLNKREIETTVLADDGQVVVLGGLLDQTDGESVERTPLLGDIPVVGNLFKSTARSRTKRNLMIFIRPRIVRSAGDAAVVTAQRYDYMRADQIARSRDATSSLDELVQAYMGAARPAAPTAQPDTVIAPSAPVEARPLPPAGPGPR